MASVKILGWGSGQQQGKISGKGVEDLLFACRSYEEGWAGHRNLQQASIFVKTKFRGLQTVGWAD